MINKETMDLTYESNKILYIGKYTLANYLTKTASMKPEEFILTLIAGNITLLEGLQKLIEAGIIHYNLRETNVMIRETNSRPIIIDFGISIDSAVEIKPTAFYIYYNEYAPWCIDIVVLSFIVNELGTDWKTKTATIVEMTRLVDEYINKNSGIKTLLFPDERQALKSTLIDFFNKYDNKPWQNVYDELLKLRNTWDNYALAVIYSTLFENLNLTQYVNDFPFLGEYKQLLKSIILSVPNERILPKDAIVQINKLFGNIPRSVNKKLEDSFAGKLRIPENIKELEKNIANAALADKETEKKVYE
jgi:GTPase SAR1 family protein